MTNKDLIESALEEVGKAKLIESYARTGGKRSSIIGAFNRGSISKEMSVRLEDLTQISALFWLMPRVYDRRGGRRKV